MPSIWKLQQDCDISYQKLQKTIDEIQMISEKDIKDYNDLEFEQPVKHDPVHHPRHYCEHPSGIECIQITEHMSFLLGNAIKYIWRADLKSGSIAGAIEDISKAIWYLQRELEKRQLEKRTKE